MASPSPPDWHTKLWGNSGLTRGEKAAANITILAKPESDRALYVPDSPEDAAASIKALISSAASAPPRLSGTGTDATTELLRSLALPSKVPSAHDGLRRVFEGQLLRKDGQPFKLPVHQWVYSMLYAGRCTIADLLEPESESKASALAVLVSSALHPTVQLHDELGDELSVAGRMDELFGRVLSLMEKYQMGQPIIRKRNRTEASLTLPSMRPDFMVLMRDALLFKGEDKPATGNVQDAKMDLLAKVQGWSSVYHGQVEYLLCYAAAGSNFELVYLPRDGDASTVYTLLTANNSTPEGKIAVIKAAMLVYSIITLQQAQLPAGAQLLNSVHGDGSCRVTLGDRWVKKEASWHFLLALGANMKRLRALYDAVRSCQYVIHALSGPTAAKNSYSVTLAPRGQPLPDDWLPADATQLAHAIRCVLLGLCAIHAAGCGHADLRWPNVILLTGSLFCIIDLELAVQLGDSQSHRKQGEDMPASWSDGAALVDGCFTAASDLFMVGRMLEGALCRIPGGDNRHPVARSLASSLINKRMTLDEALQHPWLKDLQAAVGAP